jgi:hypothetical protein
MEVAEGAQRRLQPLDRASTTVLELAELIWLKVHGPDGPPFRYVTDPPFEHDVQRRVPDVRKAREVLGFEATTTLDTMLDEVIPWIRAELEAGRPVSGRRGRARRTAWGHLRPPSSPSSCRCTTRARRVERVLRGLSSAVTTPHELVVVYDFDGDTTVPVIARLASEIPNLRGLRNDLGRGVLNAMKAGIAGTDAPYVLISMADGSDDPQAVDRMVDLARGGADVVAASRYMKGGGQVGGPLLKRLMSRAAGLSLHWFARVPTHDPTNNFKLYSRRFLESTTIESTAGFELALELTGEGDAGAAPDRGDPDDVARPHGGPEQLQAPAVAPALPALVPPRIPAPIAARKAR